MRRKFDNRWVEYRDAIDLMDCPSNINIGLCWYKKGTNNKWTYDLMDNLMVDLETYIVSLDAYELYLGDEKVFYNLINEC